MVGYCASTGGGWSRSFVAHRSQLHAAAGLPADVAVLADPLASALRPVLLHPPAEDDVVLVIGAGTIGALTVKALRLTGWAGEIAVLGRHRFQLVLAERAGASKLFRGRDEVYDWAASLPVARAYRPTLAPRFVEGGPSLVFDTVGSSGSAADALALAREGGRIIMVGTAAKVAADWTRLVIRQLSIAGVFAYGPAPFESREADSYEAALALLRRDGFADLNMVTHVFDLEDYRAAIAAALDKDGHRSIKVAFRPGA
jgi:threonine dehydrogenase-like Zn-dependent dehydrogenase